MSVLAQIVKAIGKSITTNWRIAGRAKGAASLLCRYVHAAGYKYGLRRKPVFLPVGSGTAVVEQYGDVKDFYLWISQTGSKPPEVKDNRKTEFQYTSQKVRVMRDLETTEHVCCGYVRDIDSGYALWVNGETVPLT